MANHVGGNHWYYGSKWVFSPQPRSLWICFEKKSRSEDCNSNCVKHCAWLVTLCPMVVPMFLGVTFWSRGKAEFENYILVKTPHVPWESQLLHWSHLKQRNPISLLEGVADCDVYRVLIPIPYPRCSSLHPALTTTHNKMNFARTLHHGPPKTYMLEGLYCRWWFQIFFNIHPDLGKISNLPNIYGKGWFNHQPVFYGK